MQWATPDGTPLVAHAEAVASRAERFATGFPSGIPESALSAGERATFNGFLHDLGKAIPQFQAYVRGLDDAGPLRYHSLLGALAAVYVLDQHDEPYESQLASFLTIARHHGSLPDWWEFVERVGTNKDVETPVTRQAGEIRRVDACCDVVETLLAKAADQLPSGGSATVSAEAFLSWIQTEEYQKTLHFLSTKGAPYPQKNTSLPDGIAENVLAQWSHLTLSDKTVAANLSPDDLAPDSEAITPLAIEERVEELQSESSPTSRMDELREDAREGVLQRVKAELSSDDGPGGDVYTLTLPTGFGKTFTGSQAAFTIADDLEENARDTSRFVYALPYTSVIDQTADDLMSAFTEYKRIVTGDPDVDPIDGLGSALLIHHHLSRTGTKLDDGAESDSLSRDERLLGKTWHTKGVLTTFVQLLESLAIPSNSRGLKFPHLRNSVVILDEPQTLPLDSWVLVNKLVGTLTETYNATVIFMTATQPRLFEVVDGPEPTELVPEDVLNECFEFADRVEFRFHESTPCTPTDGDPVDYESAAATLVDTAENHATLAICNTKDSTRALSTSVRRTVDGTPLDIGQVYGSVLSQLDLSEDPTTPLSEVLDDDSPLIRLTDMSVCDAFTSFSAHPFPERLQNRLRATSQSQVRTNVSVDDAVLAAVLYGYHDMLSESEQTPELDAIASGAEAHLDAIGVDPTTVRTESEATAPIITCHITTNHRPRDRLLMIRVMKALTGESVSFADGETYTLPLSLPLVCVSTQLVEAGVDISFDALYRDYAPVDNIVQAAGRCNRNSTGDTAPATIWQLEPPAGSHVDGTQPLASYVYDSEKRTVTREAVADVLTEQVGTSRNGQSYCLAESAVTRDVITEYFERLVNRGQGTQSYAEYYTNLQQTTLRDEWGGLIDDSYEDIDIFVVRTPSDMRVAIGLMEAAGNEWWETFQSLRKAIADRCVAVQKEEDGDKEPQAPEWIARTSSPLPNEESLWIMVAFDEPSPFSPRTGVEAN